MCISVGSGPVGTGLYSPEQEVEVTSLLRKTQGRVVSYAPCTKGERSTSLWIFVG